MVPQNRYAAQLRLDADDIAQTDAVAIPTRFDSFSPDRGSFKTWAMLQVRSTAQDLARRRRLRTCLDALAEDDDGTALEPADTTAGPVEFAEAAEQRATVRAAVDALPPRERAVIRARYVEGMGQAELAEMLSVSRQRIGGIEARALGRLEGDRCRLTGGERPRRGPGVNSGAASWPDRWISAEAVNSPSPAGGLELDLVPLWTGDTLEPALILEMVHFREDYRLCEVRLDLTHPRCDVVRRRRFALRIELAIHEQDG